MLTEDGREVAVQLLLASGNMEYTGSMAGWWVTYEITMDPLTWVLHCGRCAELLGAGDAVENRCDGSRDGAGATIIMLSHHNLCPCPTAATTTTPGFEVPPSLSSLWIVKYITNSNFYSITLLFKVFYDPRDQQPVKPYCTFLSLDMHSAVCQ